MKVRDIAEVFEMPVSQFAKMVGYTRVALWDIFESGKSIRPKKWRIKRLIDALESENELMYRDERTKATDRYNARLQMIEEVEKHIEGLMNDEKRVNG